MLYDLIVPSAFGLEAVTARELNRLGYEQTRTEDGRVYFRGNESDVARANLWLRTGARVQICLSRFRAVTFEELYQGVRAIPWGDLLPEDARFPMDGRSVKSTLFSISDCQAIAKKAVVDKMSEKYGRSFFEETGALYRLEVSLLKDNVTVTLDTTGAGLHKRGYRKIAGEAPLKETMAAALVTLSTYRGREDFCDPFCGSGTIPIEAALIAKNRAPGIARSFSAMAWHGFERPVWERAREEARSREFSGNYRIFASDIDPHAIELAKENARRAGVDDVVQFAVADALRFDRKTEKGIIVTNPPYGERIMEKKEAETLYAGFGRAWQATENWKLYLLSSHTEFERTFGQTADKKRKLYNGMIKCDLFMYL